MIIRIILKSIIFDQSVYLEARESNSFNSYSVLIVFLASLCTGVGTHYLTDESSIFRDLIFSFLGWIIWTSIIYIVAQKIFNEKEEFIKLARCLALAYSPNILNILGIISPIVVPIFTLTSIWTIIAFIFGVKQAFGTTAVKAFLISIISLVPYLILRLIFLFF